MSTTRRVIALMVVGCILQVVSVLGWVALGKADAPAWAKWGFVGLLVIGSLIVLYKASNLLGWQALLLCCGCLATTSVGVYQLLGFTMFPGLIKDLDLFSFAYLSRTIAVLAISFFGYAALAFLARLAPRSARA
jgi:hypothetical protein